jgi:glycerol-3-phosphate dehydrogenase
VLSKGVFLGLRRFQNHEQPLIMDTANAKDCLSLIPWGPISLWGPTETCETNLRGASTAAPADVKYLLTELNRWLPNPSSPDDIVSVRNGVRALVVSRVSPPRESTLELSRKFKIYADRDVPWISVYGGKMTDCVRLARKGVLRIRSLIGEPGTNGRRPKGVGAQQEFTSFPGLSAKVLSPRWCVQNEMCWTLEDYLRRRTNISQWVPRGGLGRDNENRGYLAKIAGEFPVCDGMPTAEDQLRRYEERIREFDRLLAAC